MDQPIYRQYQVSDQKKVWQLHLDGLRQTGSFVDDPSLDADLLAIESVYLDDGDFIVACVQNEVVGMGAIRKVDSGTVEIKRMRVSLNHQSKGIGSAILDKLIERAKELGYKKAVLDTSDQQEAAMHLYEKKGFKEYKRGELGHLNVIYYYLDLD